MDNNTSRLTKDSICIFINQSQKLTNSGNYNNNTKQCQLGPAGYVNYLNGARNGKEFKNDSNTRAIQSLHEYYALQNNHFYFRK